jgi:RimJ/RimL family protein N-acetyltransferase
MIRAFWRRLVYSYSEGGVRQIGYKIVWRIRQWIWSDIVWLLYHQDLQGFRQAPRLPLSESALDFEALLKLDYFKAHAFPEVIRERLDSGQHCHGCFLEGQFANLGWTSCGYLEIERGVRIYEKDSIAIFDCYTLPAFRSKGIYTDSLIRMLNHGRDKGALHALIAVDPDNIVSIRAIEKVGFKPLHRLTLSRRFGRRLSRESDFQASFST